MARFPLFYRGQHTTTSTGELFPLIQRTTPINADEVRHGSEHPSMTVTWYHNQGITGEDATTNVEIRPGWMNRCDPVYAEDQILESTRRTTEDRIFERNVSNMNMSDTETRTIPGRTTYFPNVDDLEQVWKVSGTSSQILAEQKTAVSLGNIVRGRYSSQGLQASSTFYRSDLIRMNPGTIISLENITGRAAIYFYSASDGTGYISFNVEIMNQTIRTQVPNNAQYVGINFELAGDLTSENTPILNEVTQIPASTDNLLTRIPRWDVSKYCLPATPSDHALFEYIQNSGKIFCFQPRIVALSNNLEDQELAYSSTLFGNQTSSSIGSYTNGELITSGNAYGINRMVIHYAKLLAEAFKSAQYRYRSIPLPESTRTPFEAYNPDNGIVSADTYDRYEILSLTTLGLKTGDTVTIQGGEIRLYQYPPDALPAGTTDKDNYKGGVGVANPYASTYDNLYSITIPADADYIGINSGRLARSVVRNQVLNTYTPVDEGQRPGNPVFLFERTAGVMTDIANALEYYVIGTGFNKMLSTPSATLASTIFAEWGDLAIQVRRIFYDAGMRNTKIAFCPYFIGSLTNIPEIPNLPNNRLIGPGRIWDRLIFLAGVGNLNANENSIKRAVMYQPPLDEPLLTSRPSTLPPSNTLCITECPSLSDAHKTPWISNWNLTGNIGNTIGGENVVRDDLTMRNYLRSVTKYLKDDNRTVIVGRVDHRRYPVFPAYQDWPDRKAINYSPHLNAKISDTSVKDVIKQICDWVDAANNTEKTDGYISGYLINQIATPRDLIEPLLKATFNVVGEVEGKVTIKHITRLDDVRSNYEHLCLVENDEKTENATAQSEGYEVYVLGYAQETDLPRTLRLSYLRDDGLYEQGIVSADKAVTLSRGIHDDQVPLLLSPFDAQEIADMMLHQMWMSREVCQLPLPPNNLDIESTDCLHITLNGRDFIFLVQNISLAEHRLVEGVMIDPEIFRRIRRDRECVV